MSYTTTTQVGSVDQPECQFDLVLPFCLKEDPRRDEGRAQSVIIQEPFDYNYYSDYP
jgi:hypothetical protein